jgi:hypothetical protein
MMFVQVPARIHRRDAMCAPGQRIHSRGEGLHSESVALRYSPDGVELGQRHDVVRRVELECILTQAPVVSLAAALPAHSVVLQSIRRGGNKAKWTGAAPLS